jgi:hypothetical protein
VVARRWNSGRQWQAQGRTRGQEDRQTLPAAEQQTESGWTHGWKGAIVVIFDQSYSFSSVPLYPDPYISHAGKATTSSFGCGIGERALQSDASEHGQESSAAALRNCCDGVASSSASLETAAESSSSMAARIPNSSWMPLEP